MLISQTENFERHITPVGINKNLTYKGEVKERRNGQVWVTLWSHSYSVMSTLTLICLERIQYLHTVETLRDVDVHEQLWLNI